MSTTKNIMIATGAAALLAAAGVSSADPIIQNLGGGWQVTIFDPDNVSIEVNNAGTIGADGRLIITKRATVSRLSSEGVPDPIVLVFQQIAPDAGTVPRIDITEEVINNQTGQLWTAYRQVLAQSGHVTFNQALSAGFSIDPFLFTNYTVTSDSVIYSGGSGVPSGGTFNPGNTAGELVIDIDLAAPVPVTFALKEIPIPSPGAVSVLALGVLAAARRRR
ncbi:MAG: hypothetical protein AB7K52_09190 [Phycisphaerales bacterium]